MNVSWKYAIRPISGTEYFDAEHDRAVRLWDELVDNYKRMEEQIMSLASADCGEIAELEQAIVVTEDRKERRQLIGRKRQLIVAWRKENKETVKSLNAERLQANKLSRQQSPCWWPNYNSVLSRFEATVSNCIKKNRRPRYHDAERDDAMLCCQIQRTSSGLGAAPDEIARGLSMLTLAQHIGHGAPGRRNLGNMRVDADGYMIYFLAYMHRPIPAGARIKAAQICCRKIATRESWSLVLALNLPDCATPPDYRRHGSLNFAIADVRVGLQITTGCEELVLPIQWVQRMIHVRALQSSLDAMRNQANEQYCEYEDILELPESQMLRELLELAKLGTLPQSLVSWRREYKRMWEEMHHLRVKLLRQRRDIFRRWAHRIVREYTELIVDDTDLSLLAMRDRGSEQNSLRQMACAHELRLELQHQARKYGSRLVDASGKVLCDYAGREKQSVGGVWGKRKAYARQRSQSEQQAQA